MPYGLNLGNIATALRMTSGSDSDPEWLGELRRREALQQPERPTLPPDTNRALEALGSGYRVPEQRSIPENPYEEPRVPTTGDQPFDPNASTRQLRGELAAGQNEALDLKQRQGDIASQGFDQQAAAAREMEGQRRAGLSQARERVDANRTQQQNYEAQAHAAFQEITSLAGNQPDASRGKALQVVAAVLSMTKNGGNIARGLQMLGNSMAGDIEKWGQRIEAQRAAQASALGMAAHEQADTQHELQTEKQLVDLGYGVYSAALERIKAETGSQEAVRVADELQNGLRAKYVEHQLDLNARGAAAAAQRQQARADDVLERMDPELLAQEIAAGNVGERGQAIYAKRMKRSQDLREGEAKIASLTNEAKAGPKMTEGERKFDTLVQGAKSAYERLLPLNGDFNRGATKETWVPDLLRSEETLQQRADIKNIGMAVLRAESGANVPDHEIEAKYEALPVNSGDPEVRAQGMRDLLRAFRALDVRGRLGSASGSAVRFQPDRPSAPAAAGGRAVARGSTGGW